MTRLPLVAALRPAVRHSVRPAATPLPVGESHGVRAYREHGAIVVRFTKRAAQLYRRIAGKRVTITCTELPEDRHPLWERRRRQRSQTFRAPKRRRPFRTGDLTRGTDYCRVWLAAAHGQATASASDGGGS